MYVFSQLSIGDQFTTDTAVWHKVSPAQAIMVRLEANPIGEPVDIPVNATVMPSSLLRRQSIDAGCPDCKCLVPHAPCSESEKEDRFYRKIEAEIDAENRERQAAEFRQSLIDERDALIARRDGLRKCVESGEYRPGESVLLAAQDMAMADYIIALGNRIVF